MTRFLRILAIGLLIFGFSQLSSSATYMWTDPDGSSHATDRIERVPAQYRALMSNDSAHYSSPGGLGFDVDGNGNYRFYDHSSPAKNVIKRNPPSGEFRPGASGSPVTPEQYKQIKMKYLTSGKEPVPEVGQGRVTQVVAPDTFELDSGLNVTYIGLAFPDQIKGETDLNKEIMAYQRKVLQGKIVHLLYGPLRKDDKGRVLAYVFVGTDMFVNADLIMNGYARMNITPPNTEYRVLFTRLEEFAKRAHLGIWTSGTVLPQEAAK